jgi:hypothetical protein
MMMRTRRDLGTAVERKTQASVQYFFFWAGFGSKCWGTFEFIGSQQQVFDPVLSVLLGSVAGILDVPSQGESLELELLVLGAVYE